MDQQLKQRLIGVTIVVALVVIFVPMLFEKSDDKGKLGSLGIPSIPDEVLEKTIELPKSAEDVAPKDEEKKTVESGYRIVPLNNEETSPKPKPTETSVEQPNNAETNPVKENHLVPEEEDNTGMVTSSKKKEKENPSVGTATLVPVQTPAAANLESHDKQRVHHRHIKAKKKPKTAAASNTMPDTEPDEGLTPQEEQLHNPIKTESPLPKRHHSHSHTASHAKLEEPANNPTTAVKKSENPSLYHQPKVKVKKPKPVALPEADRDLDDEPVPAPAKPETPLAKAKAITAKSEKPKIHRHPKPSAEHPTAVKAGKPVTSPAEAVSPPVKPKAPKPAPAKPAKTADPD